MKKLLTTAVVALAVALTASSASASNAGPPDCVPGCRINILSGTPTTYPAGEPFVILHSVSNGGTRAPQAIGMDVFTLEVDGTPRTPDANFRTAFPPPEFGLPFAIVQNSFVFDFSGGMTGTHTFTGHWYESCANAVADGRLTGPCPDPAEQVEFITRSLTVQFTS